ncbi:FAD-dependent oxidoreductase [Nonomuraea roseoviolacea subsp. roseoviolacea]|uniref:NADPH-dependent 2,4-dienoyl-CoA reductase/sulfur reductase-like enzyme n=1 Tax=Nonomuraea roseoviolacea subsp. carminata TaxID=160689 RepID=A0ABT1KG00_9ACTN|nr:FAD/NAD(P)-binding oxidoreductase [Nonomuraea roseoviolacea]MCP2352922.1 NADPH-dependent 2,4-dienoyl-CoA reductase/sulfur reductase-like enzyme [Nonomuraea roseoviolacea subsp. carminata]
MSRLKRITVVGASLAGLRAVQTLRREGFDGEITLVGAETHLPYNRPPLSKSVLRGDDDVALPGAEELGDQWLRGRRAVRLDVRERTVGLDDGTEIGHDGLVIATGARPRRLDGAHRLRTIDDALALRARLDSGHEHVLVIGGGFIGGEVASTARQLGRKVTLVDAAPYPMRAGLGEDAARWLAAHHERNGVELVTNARVTAVSGGRVHLADGRSIAADLVVGGMGVTPNTEWLDGSGLTTDDGVLCLPTLFARGAGDIVAAGDVARWPHGLFGGETVRVEHWSNANEQGAIAARNLLAGPENATPFLDVPNHATHVHGARIQTAGLPHLADAASIVTGSPEDDRFAVAFTRDGVLVGAVAVNSPKDVVRLKRAITARETL